MKKIAILLLLLSITSPTWAAVEARVCLSDGVTPLELADPCIPNVYRDIMVGTKLTMIVSSNVAEDGYGGVLVLKEAEMADRGLLYGRPPINEYGNYLGSCLPDAGKQPEVYDAYGYPPGFETYVGVDPNAGDWFIFDYNALDIGDCEIELRDFYAVPELVQTLSLNHVRTRDFDGNTCVDFADFALLASYWLETDCGSIDNCEGTDLDTDGDVDFYDFTLFCEFWLEKTE
jgi:hypothetical protein